MTLYYKNRDRITTKIDVDYKTNTVTKSVKRRMGAWRVIITPLDLHNSESLVIIYGNEQRLRWRKAFRTLFAFCRIRFCV